MKRKSRLRKTKKVIKAGIIPSAMVIETNGDFKMKSGGVFPLGVTVIMHGKKK